MGYEGYRQMLCAGGHYYTYDAWASSEEETCPCCGGTAAWLWSVDTTNWAGFPMRLVPFGGTQPEEPVGGRVYVRPTAEEMRVHEAYVQGEEARLFEAAAAEPETGCTHGGSAVCTEASCAPYHLKRAAEEAAAC